MDTRTALARALGRSKRDLAAEWLRQLGHDAATSSGTLEAVDSSPASTLEARARAIEWITNRIGDAAPPAPPAPPAPATEAPDALELLVRHWLTEGRTLGELVLELRILGRILVDALVAEVETGHEDLRPARAARIAADLGEGVTEALQRIATLSAGEGPGTQGEAGRVLDEYGRIVTHELIDSLTAAELAAEALVSIDFGADGRHREIALRVQAGLREVGEVVEKIRLLTLWADEASRGVPASAERRPPTP